MYYANIRHKGTAVFGVQQAKEERRSVAMVKNSPAGKNRLKGQNVHLAF